MTADDHNRVHQPTARCRSCSGSPGLRALFDCQREAFLRDGTPSLAQRRADLAKLAHAIRNNAERIADVISADFGNRSAGETLLAEVWTTVTAIRHTSRHLGRWMKPRRATVGLELMPARARILCQPLGVVGIISP
jgi:coniferyl-aldehyde dehydrogenase